MTVTPNNSQSSPAPAQAAEENLDPAKDAAESAKFKAETRKLDAEARYLARPFWQRTETLGLAGSILVAAVGLGGVIWTQSIKDKQELLDAQKSQLEKSQKEFDDSRKALAPHIRELELQQGALEASVAELSTKSVAESNALEQQLEHNTELQTAAKTLQQERDKLQTDAQYAQIDVLMEQMERDYAVSDASRADEQIRRLFREAPADERARLIARCEQRATRATIDARIRLIIYDMLYSVTGDPRFKTELIKFAEKYFFASQTDLPIKKVQEYQNIIWGTILRNDFEHSLLDPADSRLLVNALWEHGLNFGGKLKDASVEELDEFLSLNRFALLDHPEAYFKTVAEIQQRLLHATDPRAMESLASILGSHAPQCLVLTWYFDHGSTHWQSSAKESFKRAEGNLRDNAPSDPFYSIRIMPTPDAAVVRVSVKDWEAANGKLIKFWVPINYDQRVYDPLIQVILHHDGAISLSDLPKDF
jgi:uncharacterized membrane-anchored protein YhcB (DUF1043 family)